MAKVEAYACDKCGAVYKTQEEADDCKQCGFAFCPEWGMAISKKTCDECMERKLTGAGSYMVAKEGEDPMEPGGMEKVAYSGKKCEYRSTFLNNLDKKQENIEFSEDIQKILDEMTEEKRKLIDSKIDPEKAAQLVREGKGILGDPSEQLQKEMAEREKTKGDK